MSDRVVIAFDFDDTLVKRYSIIGTDIEDCGAVPWLRALQTDPRVHLILWTCRTGRYLPIAFDWLAEHGITMEINSNMVWERQVAHLGPSRKVLADLYIDDKGFGIPLRPDGVVDWERVGPMLLAWVEEKLR